MPAASSRDEYRQFFVDVSALSGYYSDGSGHFKLPVHLEAQGSATIDMAKVIAGGERDVDGNVIPARVRYGSAVFASPKGVTSPIHLALCGMHFSAQLGVAEACCVCCSGYCGLYICLLTSCPTAGLPGEKIQLSAQAYYSDGTVHDFTSSAIWSSNSTAVATVAAGLVTGVAAGSSTITASKSLTAQGVHLVGCGTCPGVQLMTGGQTDSFTSTTASQHTYPNSPLNECYVGTPFDAPIRRREEAQRAGPEIRWNSDWDDRLCGGSRYGD